MAKRITGKSNKPAEQILEIKEGRSKVPVSHPNKIYWPEEKITKGMLVEYYQSVAEYILPFLKNRPESLLRNPNGIKDSGFFHKDAGENVPSFVKSFPVEAGNSDKIIDYIICNNKLTLAYLNNLGCIEINPWHSTTKFPDKPDYVIIDIDPSQENSFDQVIETALAFKSLLDKASIPGYCKTSGASGLHIYIPLGHKYSYDEAKNFAHILCLSVAGMLPSFTTLERNLKKRGTKHMYLDYLQNRKGQTISSVYSVRPKKGATVSMPLDWEEVKRGLHPSQFTIFNALKRIQKKPDMFREILKKGIDMKKALTQLGSL